MYIFVHQTSGHRGLSGAAIAKMQSSGQAPDDEESKKVNDIMTYGG